MTNLIALPHGTELVGDYRIERVLGAGGFGITYLADEMALDRRVTIKEYFPSDFAARSSDREVAPRSEQCAGDYRWGLDRFIEEAQTLARFSHPHIVRVYRYFRANNTGYMVLHFEEGQSLKSWLKGLGRAPRQKELDAIVAPLLDALALIHNAEFLHRDIAPDNIIIRKNGEPVLIDFGSARGEIAVHSKTVSALVKPGYSPYEQYAERSSQQGPWTDIYALGATLYHAVTGKRPPDSPSRMVKDEIVPAREAALSSYRPGFLAAIDKALALNIDQRPRSVAAWRGDLLAPEPPKPGWLGRALERKPDAEAAAAAAASPAGAPPPPDAPGPQGVLLDYVEGLKRSTGTHVGAAPVAGGAGAAPPVAPSPQPRAAAPGAATEPVDIAPPRAIAKGKKSAPRDAKVAPAAALPVPVPKATRGPERRPPPRPSRGWSAPRLRPLLFKLAIGVGIASAAVAMQDKLPRLGAGTATTAGSSSVSSGASSGLGSEKAGQGDRKRTAQAGRSAAAGESYALPVSPLGELKGHTGAVATVVFTDDGRSIVTTGADGTLRIWSATTGGLTRTVRMDDGPATTIALSGTRALTGHADGRVLLWDLDRGDRPRAFKRNDADIWSVTFAGDGNHFAASGHDWKVALWDAGSQGAPLHVFDGHESAAQAVAYSPRRRLLASGGADRTVKLWNMETLDLERTYKGHSDFVTSLAFSPDGKMLAAAALDGTIRLWSTGSSRLFRTLNGHKGRVTSLAFSPSGEVLASASDDGAVRLWDFKRGRTARTLVAHSGSVNAVAFSTDGERVAAAGDDGVVRIWPAALPRRTD